MFSSGLVDRRKGWFLLAAVFVAALVFALLRLLQGGADATPQLVTSAAGPAQMMETGSPALKIAGVSHHDPLENVKYAPDVLVVRFDRGASAAERRAARNAVGAKKKKSLALPGAELLTLPRNSNERAVAAKLSKQPGVKYSEPDGVAHVALTPDDAEFGKLWGLNNTGQDDGTADADIDAPEAWNTTTGSSSVVTAVIDTGVDYNHEDLSENIWENPGETGTDENGNPEKNNGIDDDHNGWVDDWRGVNMVGENNTPFNDPMDDHFHGTHVAGTIAAKGNNGVGVAGVTWNTKIMPVKVLSSGGSGFNSVIADGMAYAGDEHARIANLSLGGTGRSQYMEDVVASHPNTLYVVAAGNSGTNNDTDQAFYPCNLNLDNVICVAATDRNDALASFSDFGPQNVDLAAPGVDILSAKASVDTDHAGNYSSHSGTSMATPHVAGAASLLLADKPQATTEQLRDALLDGVDKISSVDGKVASGGRLNVNTSLSKLNATLTRDPATTTVELGGSGDLRFISGAGLSENVSVWQDLSSGKITFTDDAAQILSGDGCSSTSLHQAQCPTSGVQRIVVSTADGNDSIQVNSDLPTKLNAGSGNDSVNGGAGNDEVIDGPGSDTYYAWGGVDTISYSTRTAPVAVSLDGIANDGESGEGDNVSTTFETVLGGSGNDTLSAGSYGATLKGNAGNDTLTGGPGNDTIFDGAGSDVVSAADGDDALTYTDRDGADVWNGGAGVDTLDGSKVGDRYGMHVSLDGVANDGLSADDNFQTDIENITGTDEGDFLVGGPGDNQIDGGEGSDTLDGGSGGSDDLRGGGSRQDTVTYASRAENLNLSIDDSANDGSSGEHDNIHRDIEQVTGGSGDDTIIGDSGGGSQTPEVDLLGEHYETNDVLQGGPGADTISGGSGTDVATYSERNSAQPVNVSIDGSANDGETGEHDNVATDVEAVMGGYGNDVITGSNHADVLNGGWTGDDTINGEGGDDTLSGGGLNQHDIFNGGDGTDTVDYWGDVTTGYGAYDTPVSITLDGVDNDGYAGSTDHYSSDVEAFRGGMADDTLVGDSGSNILDGGGGTNSVSGGDGNDTLIGGGKNSIVSGGNGDDVVKSVWFKWFRQYWYGGISQGGVFFGVGGGDVDGGSGNDKLFGSASGSENLTGGDGNDTLDGSYGPDTLSGGAGADVADYSDRVEYLDVSLDGVANDGWTNSSGGSGEKDQVLSDVENVTTGAGNDKLTGDTGANKLDGGLGVDQIFAGDGNDQLIGGDDADQLFAEGGNDLIKTADDSADEVSCGDGIDSVHSDSADTLASDCEPAGTPNAPEVSAGLGFATAEKIDYDSVPGQADNVTVTTTPGSAVFTATGHSLDAGDGCVQVSTNQVTCQFVDATDLEINAHLGDQDDTFAISPAASIAAQIYGGAGDDTLTGGPSDDVIDGGTGADQIDGGAGSRDVVTYLNRQAGVNVSLDGVANDGALGEMDNVAVTVEDITGGHGDDVLTGSSGDNHFWAMDGNDLMDGGSGSDWFFGYLGKDTVSYASRTNPVTIAPTYALPSNYYDAAFGASVWSGEAGEYDWVGSDTENEVGGSGSDTLRCDESVYGMSNVMDGGPGTDTYNGCGLKEQEGSSDTVTYASRTAAISASLDGAANDGAAGENENIPSGVENVTGGSGNDSIVGDSAANVLTGGSGDDSIDSRDSVKDTVACNAGSDTATVDYLDEMSDCETVNGSAHVAVSGSTVTYVSSDGVASSLVVTQAGSAITFTDTGTTFDAGNGCSVTATHIATCTAPTIATLSISTKDGNDAVTNESNLGGTIDTGSGDDTLVGSSATETFTGGDGTDSLSYVARSEPLSLTMDGVANDGATGENDKISSDIEDVTGGSGADTITGSIGSANSLSGGPGDDTISSADGSTDHVDCGTGADAADVDSFDVVATGCESLVTQPASRVSLSNNVVQFETAAGIANVVSIGGSASSISVSENSGQLFGAGPGCVQQSPTLVDCNNAQAITAINLDTGDLNDDVQSDPNLQIPMTMNGGSGDDHMMGGSLGDTFIGGPGAWDQFAYMNRHDPIVASPNGTATSGAPGEHDQINTDVELLIGGMGNDTLTGTEGNDILFGWSGDDRLFGLGGNDDLSGDDGSDVIDGGLGDDLIKGGDGYNTATYASRSENITAKSGVDDTANNGAPGENDIFYGIQNLAGGSGNDTLTDLAPEYEALGVGFSGGDGNDTLNGGFAQDYLDGGSGNDTLNGGNEDTSNYWGDQLVGGPGNDSLSGGSGNDTLDGGAGGDTLDGGNDHDYVDISTHTANETITFDNIANDGDPGEGDNYKNSIEEIALGDGNNVVDGTTKGSVPLYVTSGSGNDVLTGGSGPDVLNGGDGDDVLTGGLGADQTWGGWGFDTVSYADHTTGVNVSIDGSATDGSPGEKDYVTDDNERIVGSPQNDTLKGGSNNNTLEGGNGDDTFNSDSGADIVNGGAGIDTASYSSRTAHVDITLDNTANDGAAGEGDNILPSVEKITGGSGGDFLKGDGGDNTLTGNAGTDTMMGEAGTDVFDGGADTDIVSYADQTAAIVAAIDDWPNDGIPGENDNIKSNVENVQGSQGSSTLTGSSSANELSGGGGGVVVAYGQGGNDVLYGASGSDTLTGGTGQDTFDAGDGNDTVNASDGEVDTGTCGNGTDTIDSDVIDTIASCEVTPTPPDTTITAGPADGGYSATATPTFTMTSTPAGAGFQCSIDGAAFADCSSPYTTPTLSTVGTRTVAIRAKNAAGFVDPSPASRTFTVDLTSPTLSVTSPGPWVNTLTPWIVFSASDNIGLQPTKCAVDGGTPFTCTTNSNLPSESVGPHTLVVTATDLAGNATNVTKGYTIDVTAPALTVTGPVGLQTTATPTLQFTTSDANGTTTTCAYDWSIVYTACAPGAMASQSYGSHNVTVKSVDPAGNTTVSPMTSFVVDTTPADVSVSGSVLSIAPDAGYNNSTNVSFASGTYTIYETGRPSIKAGAGCVNTDAIHVTCTSASITSISADMGDGNDQITLGSTVTVPATLNGGPGTDGVYGGSGADTLNGGTGADAMDGGTGVDTVTYSDRTNPIVASNDGNVNDGEAGEGDSIGNGVESMIGGSGNDTFYSYNIATSEVFNGGAGTDTISYASYSSAVTLNLGTTTAQATGAAGTDTVSNLENVVGGTGADNLTGTAGDNVITGLAGNDTINGAGNGTAGDTVDYGAASSGVNVNLISGAVTGGAGSDTLSAIENVTGSASNDTISSAAGANIINGAGGVDTISYATIATAVTVNLNTTTAQATGGGGSDTITNVENVTGGTAADNLTGSGGDNVIAGLAGNDVLAGGAGTDTLDDSAATTAVIVNLASSTASGGAGTDTISGFENITGSTAADTLTPSSGNNVIDGAGGADTITYATAAAATGPVTLSLSPTTAQTTGGSGSETVLNVENVIGSGFNDTLSGSSAANAITGGAGTDTVSYANSTAGVTFNLTTTVAQNTVGAGSDTVTQMENLTGSPFNDTLTGDTLANTITGGLGVDTVNAGSGNDTVVVRDGVNDANTVCGAGTDIFTADLVSVGDPNTSNDCESPSRG